MLIGMIQIGIKHRNAPSSWLIKSELWVFYWMYFSCGIKVISNVHIKKSKRERTSKTRKSSYWIECHVMSLLYIFSIQIQRNTHTDLTLSLILHHNNSVTVSQPSSYNVFYSIQMRAGKKIQPFAILVGCE